MIDIATAAQQLYEEISTCQGTKKAPSCQVEADLFNTDSNRHSIQLTAAQSLSLQGQGQCEKTWCSKSQGAWLCSCFRNITLYQHQQLMSLHY
ncbi:TPA: hypothetical protein ACH3X2_003075 [Trebouxia sp. C0005]